MVKIKSKDSLGDRMKSYERQTTGQYLIAGLPLYARLDGRAFHTFCRGFDKPFDLDFKSLMQQTTKTLIEKTGAAVGYTQSDEINLAWTDVKSVPFEGKIHKLTSLLASIATSAFTINGLKNDKLRAKIEKTMPTFDCRICQMPTESEVANMFIWRELDATRNAINMVAQANFSHKSLQGLNTDQVQEKLWQEKRINFNDFDSTLKRGSYFRRKVKLIPCSDDIPEKYRPADGLVTRTVVDLDKLPISTKIANLSGVLLHNEDPVLKVEIADE